uniref:Immunoglobulin V-set domain-containing protein n=1 Tax=Myripristis murdjan TaxID=586833 RepID=A0A668A4J4_9TELE
MKYQKRWLQSNRLFTQEGSSEEKLGDEASVFVFIKTKTQVSGTATSPVCFCCTTRFIPISSLKLRPSRHLTVHPSFKNRVELKDKKMKNGDLSVILKNVKKEDSGTYECHFIAAGAKHMKRAIIKTPPISTIRLEVVDPGEFNWDRMTSDLRSVLFHVGVLIVVLSAVAAVMHRKQRASREHRQVKSEVV